MLFPSGSSLAALLAGIGQVGGANSQTYLARDAPQVFQPSSEEIPSRMLPALLLKVLRANHK